MPDIILHLITALNENTGARYQGLTETVQYKISSTSGVREGGISAPILFCVAINWIILHMSFNPGIAVGSSTFTDLYCESKKQDTKLLPITSPNVNRFLKFFQ